MRTTGLVVFALVFALAVAAAGSASARLDSLPTRFGGFPPKGVEASPFTTGRLLIGLRPRATTTWNVYADGWVIWQKWTSSGVASVVPDGARRLDTGYVYQRLTRQGVQLLRSRLLATGLFEHNLKLAVGRHHAWVFHQVRRGDRLVTVSGVPSPDPSWNQTLHRPNAGPDAGARVDREIRGRSGQLASGESVGGPADPGVRAGSLPARFRSVLSRSLEAASSSPQGARPVQAAQEPRVPDRDDGPGAGTRSGVREGWDIALAEQCRHYRLRPRRHGAPLRLIPPPAPCASRRSLLARPLRGRGQGAVLFARSASSPGPSERR